MLGVIVLFVIVASSVVLVYKLGALTGDVMISKHEEARILVDQYRSAGLSFKQAAPKLVDQLSGIGLRVAVYDTKGRFLSGDQDVHPHFLDEFASRRVATELPTTEAQVRGMLKSLPKNGKSVVIYNNGFALGPPPAGVAPLPGLSLDRVGVYSIGPTPAPRGASHTPRRDENVTQRFIMHEILARPTGPHAEPTGLAVVNGGYVAFAPSLALIWISLVPYWKFIVTIAVIAIALSWFLGWQFSKQALRPLHDVTLALQELGHGRYSQQRFVLADDAEMAQLTSAYNQAAANVSASMEERKRTEERMRQFVADASHELRTPLTVIAGYIDVLRRGAVEEPTVARQILGTMAIEKEHMRALIDRLMQLARLDEDAPPVKAPIEVAELLRSQCEAARRLDPAREIDYQVDGASHIHGDRAELGEALWNIVENAMKYAPGAPIHLSATRTNGKTAIRVHDGGPGMTDTERMRAFERFYRGESRGEITGSGLGLAIAKRAVERADGEISIESAPGRGTTVTLNLA